MGGIDHAQKRGLWVCVRKHQRGREHAPIGQRHANGAAMLDADATHRGFGQDRAAQRAHGGRHRLCDPAHAADHMAAKALRIMIASAKQVEQQAQRGPGIIRSAVLAINVVRQKQPLGFIAFEMAVQKFGERSGHELEQRGRLGAAYPPKPPRHAPQFADAGHAGGVDMRRRFEEKRLEIARQPPQLGIDAQIRFAILGRKARQFAGGALRIGPEPQRRAIPGHDA